MLSLIQYYRDEYDRIGRSDKFRIIEEIMGKIEGRGGRFMEYKQNYKHWEEVPRAAAYNKVSHAFRSLRRANLPPETKKRSHPSNERSMETTDSESSVVGNGFIAPMHGIPPFMNPAMTGFESSTFAQLPMVGTSFNISGAVPGWGVMSSDPHQSYWTQPRVDPDGPDPLITPMPDVAVGDDAQNVCAV
jgi:hypothetical protein